MSPKDQLVDDALGALKKLSGYRAGLVAAYTDAEHGRAIGQVYGGLMRMQKRELEGLILVLNRAIERTRGDES
jgi:hypothetical protein